MPLLLNGRVQVLTGEGLLTEPGIPKKESLRLIPNGTSFGNFRPTSPTTALFPVVEPDRGLGSLWSRQNTVVVPVKKSRAGE